MEIQIILTSYLLRFMYGDRAFQDPLLLSLEIIKKAYNEGLYFVTSEKNIEYILENGVLPQRSIFVFAGIPSFQEVCIDLSPSEKLVALKILAPYEELAKFAYQEEDDKTLIGRCVDLSDAQMEKVELILDYHDKKLQYEIWEGTAKKVFNELEKEEIIHAFSQEIRNYHYTIINKLAYLRDSLVDFLQSSSSDKILDDAVTLQKVAQQYEILCGALSGRK